MSDHGTGGSGAVSRSRGALAPPEPEGAACTPGACTCTGQENAAPREGIATGHGDGAPAESGWAPPECALPADRRPERVAEFDALFSAAVQGVARPEPTVLRLVLDARHEAAARELAAQESGCCSFFTFTFTPSTDGVHWHITVPEAQTEVLDALAERATAAGASR
ncbi:hypothetical protein EKD16_22170 [Streptomonospora litoralis]|uniref:Arsenate reductase n=1 Tax=Streptomonospora litoralis TaxID=2498135 RepID=A0A4P6QAD2_9ACTN|nr:hypothetical protein EKD16_22170 [Streptomonospora litoralis]